MLGGILMVRSLEIAGNPSAGQTSGLLSVMPWRSASTLPSCMAAYDLRKRPMLGPRRNFGASLRIDDSSKPRTVMAQPMVTSDDVMVLLGTATRPLASAVSPAGLDKVTL